MKASVKWAAIAVGCAGMVAVAFEGGRAWAGGIPPAGALNYSGLLQDAAGAPLSGTQYVEVRFWNDVTASASTNLLCDSGTPTGVSLTQGHFSIALPDVCTTKVGSNSGIWAEVLVGNTPDAASSLGRAKLGAVPFAIEANHALSADSATTAPRVLRPTPFFKWSPVTAASTDTETFPVEGTQTITFADAGYYRITLNVHCIHDTNTTASVWWYLGGSATRLDSFSLEGGAKGIQWIQPPPEGRLVESTDVFVSATAGQSLTIKPSLTVSYSNGALHEATFMYAAEYLGPQ